MHLRRAIPLTLALLAGAAPALAQPSKSELEAAKKEAVAIADKAVDAFRAEKYQAAIDGFRKADAKFHVPKFLLYVARAQVKLGKLLDARATYRSILDEKLPAYAPAEFFTAQADAKKEAAALEPKIPTVRVEVDGVPAGSKATVTIDGEALAPAEIGAPVQRDPGPHTVVVSAAGRQAVQRTVTLREGGSESVIVEIGAAPAPEHGAPTASASASVPSASSTGDAGAAPARSGGVPTASFVLFGVGAAGLVVGGVFGGLALGKYNDYNAHPTKDSLDSGRTFSLVADIGFGTAVAGAAAGTIYWLVSRSGSKRPAADAPPSKGSIVVVPAVGSAFGGVTATGRF
jgi:hypothetical protein